MQTGPTIQKHDLIRFEDGEPFGFGTVGGRFQIASAATGGRFVVAEMPEIPPRTLAPLHRHNKEDEYTHVLAGTLGAMAGEEAVTVGPGTWLKTGTPARWACTCVCARRTSRPITRRPSRRLQCSRKSRHPS